MWLFQKIWEGLLLGLILNRSIRYRERFYLYVLQAATLTLTCLCSNSGVKYIRHYNKLILQVVARLAGTRQHGGLLSGMLKITGIHQEFNFLGQFMAFLCQP